MNRAQNVRPVAGTTERTGTETAAGKAAVSYEGHFITNGAGRQQGSIASLLSHGAENAVHLRDLVTITGRNERDVRRQIAAERKRGIMILANNKDGYYLPGNPDELRRFSKSMAHRTSEVMAAARMAETAYAEALGQETVEGW